MQANGWRNLSVLVLASVALMGCNNTPGKDRSLGANTQGTSKALAQQQSNQAPFPVDPRTQTTNQSNQQKTPLIPTSKPGTPGPFGPASSSTNQPDPFFNPLLPKNNTDPTLRPVSPSSNSNSFGPPPGPGGPPLSPINLSPSPPTGFGVERNTIPLGGGPDIPPPLPIPQR